MHIVLNAYKLSIFQRLHSLAAVDDDVLRSDATFKHAHLWMISATTEQTRGFNAEISNAFPVVVHDAEAIFL